MSDKLTSAQRVAVLTALSKAVRASLEEARIEADQEAYALYEGFGSDRIKIEMGGVEVGTLSLTFSKDAYEVVDREAFEDFCLANGLGRLEKSIRPEYMPAVLASLSHSIPEALTESFVLDKGADKLMRRVGEAFVIEGTDEVVPGISPKPITVTGTRVTGCKPDVVLPTLSALPGGVESLLLGGGSDE